MKKVSQDGEEFIRELQKKECFLCSIPYDNPIFEDSGFVVVLEESPAVKRRIIIAPKKHFKNLSELSKEEANKLMSLLRKYDDALVKLFNPFRLFIVQTGLSVEHFHFHLVPVHDEEMTWNFKYPKKDNVIEYSEKEKAEVIKRIREVY
jgi:diadenosine tetraphosphate (Ap4A) HIT family hydrolase